MMSERRPRLRDSVPINQATFLMSNMVAQAPDNNQGPWANLEGYLRTLLPGQDLYIVSGPHGIGGTGSNGGLSTSIANDHVAVPAETLEGRADGSEGDAYTRNRRVAHARSPDAEHSDDQHRLAHLHHDGR